MTTPEKSVEEIEEDYVKMWDSGQFEWNHHEGDEIGKKPISPYRIWTTFIRPLLEAELQKQEEMVKTERERLKRFVGMRFLKTDEAKQMQNEIMKALTQSNNQKI